MNELIAKIQSDSTLTLMAIIAVVVFLVIVLTIIVSAMRVKTYKDRFWNVEIDNKEKTAYISKIEKELQTYKIKNASNEQLLEQFSETKEVLKATNEEHKGLQKKYNEREKELSQTKATLESVEGIYANLLEEYKILKERLDELQENNGKYRTSNARLLMKLESEERYANVQKEMILAHKKEIKEVKSTMQKKRKNEENG